MVLSIQLKRRKRSPFTESVNKAYTKGESMPGLLVHSAMKLTYNWCINNKLAPIFSEIIANVGGAYI